MMNVCFGCKRVPPAWFRRRERVKAFGNKLEGVSLRDYLDEKLFSRCEVREGDIVV